MIRTERRRQEEIVTDGRDLQERIRQLEAEVAALREAVVRLRLQAGAT